jgi:hypothetical protein
VLTVSPALPATMLDQILTSTEMTLLEHGADHVWIDPAQPPLAVVAAFPAIRDQQGRCSFVDDG